METILAIVVVVESMIIMYLHYRLMQTNRGVGELNERIKFVSECIENADLGKLIDGFNERSSNRRYQD